MLERLRAFSDAASARNLNGLDFQHVALCRRRCWMHRKRCHFNHASDHVALGELLHEASYRRDRSTTELSGLAPDKIDWARRRVLEIKKSASHTEAASQQLAFYVMMLSAVTGDVWEGSLQFVGGRRRVEVRLDAARMDACERAMAEIVEIDAMAAPPAATKLAVCEGCSNGEFCWGERGA